MNAAVRGSPHVLNFLLVCGFTAPILLYASRGPSSAELEETLREADPVAVNRAATSSERMGDFWRSKRSSLEMERVYSDLLRSGAGGKKRLHELTGPAAEAESAAARAKLYARRAEQAVAAPVSTPESTPPVPVSA